MAALHEGGTAGAALISAIARHADRPAIADNNTRWTYRELGEAAGRVMALFRSLGLQRGGAVSVLSSNRVETWAVVTAAAIMGLRYTPLHPLAAEDDQAFIVEDAEIDALIVEAAKYSERGLAIRARSRSIARCRSSFSRLARNRRVTVVRTTAATTPITPIATNN